MDLFSLAEVTAAHRAGGRRYHEFLRVPALNVGLYVLSAGDVDPQQPHAEDEVYAVINGRARLTVGDETREVGPGDIAYVAAGVPHRFHDISDDLALLVVFAGGPAAPPPAGMARPTSPA